MKRYSRKREAILAVMRSTPVHPTAEWVFERLKPDYPDLSLATVYRNITAFLETGEIVSVGVVDGRERFDADTRPHYHFICGRCGAVMDVERGDDTLMKKCAEEITCGRVTGHSVIFRGICRDCMLREDTSAEPCI